MDDCENYKVYAHISPTNKIYIGITKQQKVNERWRKGKGYIKNDHFYRAILKFGWDNFKHIIIIEDLSKDMACEIEKYLIKKYKTNDYNYGYNICDGGEGCNGLKGSKNPNYGHKWSEEQKQKMSKIKKDLHIHHTEEWKKEQSKRTKELWKNSEYREKCGNTCKGRVGELHPMFGKKGKDNPNSKIVLCVETNEIFYSASEASKAKNCNHSKICMVCRGERKTCGGFTWRYIDKKEEK